MTAIFPDGIKTFREKENRPGFDYDPDRPRNLYAEDVRQMEEEIVAIETFLGEDGENLPVGLPPGGSVDQVLSKATGDDYDVEWVDASGGSSKNTEIRWAFGLYDKAYAA